MTRLASLSTTAIVVRANFAANSVMNDCQILESPRPSLHAAGSGSGVGADWSRIVRAADGAFRSARSKRSISARWRLWAAESCSIRRSRGRAEPARLAQLSSCAASANAERGSTRRRAAGARVRSRAGRSVAVVRDSGLAPGIVPLRSRVTSFRACLAIGIKRRVSQAFLGATSRRSRSLAAALPVRDLRPDCDAQPRQWWRARSPSASTALRYQPYDLLSGSQLDVLVLTRPFVYQCRSVNASQVSGAAASGSWC
jgi:hypothetical protein